MSTATLADVHLLWGDAHRAVWALLEAFLRERRAQHEQLREGRPSFWDSLQRFRRDHIAQQRLAAGQVQRAFWDDLRDRSPGRKVRL